MAAQEEKLEKEQKQNQIKQPEIVTNEEIKTDSIIDLPEVPQHIPVTLPSVPTTEIHIKKSAELSA